VVAKRGKGRPWATEEPAPAPSILGWLRNQGSTTGAVSAAALAPEAWTVVREWDDLVGSERRRGRRAPKPVTRTRGMIRTS
jgi:hypothetical protein